jgi:hypothetical protein
MLCLSCQRSAVRREMCAVLYDVATGTKAQPSTLMSYRAPPAEVELNSGPSVADLSLLDWNADGKMKYPYCTRSIVTTTTQTSSSTSSFLQHHLIVFLLLWGTNSTKVDCSNSSSRFLRFKTRRHEVSCEGVIETVT